MAILDAAPPRRRRHLAKALAVFAWLMLYAVLCAVMLIAAVGFVGLLIMLHH